MKIRSILYQLIVLAGLATTIVILIFMYNEKSNKAERFEQNFFQDTANAKYFLSPKEFKKFLQQDSIKNAYLLKNIDDLGLKFKQIQNVTKIFNNYHTFDTTIISSYPVKDENNIFQFTYDDGCMKYTGWYDCDKMQYTQIESAFDNEMNIIEYWKRPLIFDSIRWLKNPFKKLYFRDVKTKCGESTYEEIVISKKMKQ